VALDRLELDLLMTQRMLEDGRPAALEPWDVPELDGPMPERLVPRARELRERQAALGQALREALVSNGRQRALTDRVNRTSGTDLASPAFVDLTA
jgi:hypothetical protein